MNSLPASYFLYWKISTRRTHVNQCSFILRQHCPQKQSDFPSFSAFYSYQNRSFVYLKVRKSDWEQFIPWSCEWCKQRSRISWNHIVISAATVYLSKRYPKQLCKMENLLCTLVISIRIWVDKSPILRSHYTPTITFRVSLKIHNHKLGSNHSLIFFPF